MEDVKHVIALLSKGHISVWTDNDLKFNDPHDPHQTRIPCKVLGQIMDIKQENIDRVPGLKTTIASAHPHHYRRKKMTYKSINQSMLFIKLIT